LDFYVMAKSYSMYGAHSTLTPIASVLMAGAGDFGSAIKELTVTLHLRNIGTPKKSLQRLLEQHNSYRLTLPKITYRKAKGKVEIDVASELVEDRVGKASHGPSLRVFEQGLGEVCCALALLKSRVKPSDAFDLDAFLAHCEAARQRIPGSEAALQSLALALSAAEKTTRKNLSPWEKLDIDWGSFHPRAREILDDPFFWDDADGLSPNGSDTGADLLGAYRRWRKDCLDTDPLHFFRHLCVTWGYEDAESMDDEMRHDAIVGLAFAEFKLRGACDEHVLTLAMDSIRRQRVRAESSAIWPHRAELLEALKRIECKLKQCR
jgi:uncharacterized protein YfeS